MIKKTIFILSLFSLFSLQAQDKKEFKIAAIGFYNVENLYDTLDQALVNDQEFLPGGKKNYNSKVYYQKLENLADVISKLGTEITPDGLAIMGMAEIENKSVVEDLVRRPKLANRNYQVIQYDSPDERGVDVAMIYQPKYFTPVYSAPIRLNQTYADGKPRHTRDILHVKGLLDGDTIHVFVNHWPSRRGGQSASEKYRKDAAMACKVVCDSLLKANPKAKLFVMGDLNDDPTNASVAEVMGAVGDKKNVTDTGFYNPMHKFYKAGIGTLAYDDAWNLFDQIMISKATIDEKAEGYRYYKTRIFNEPFLTNKSGAYKGYPHRTYVGDRYENGYSDHFPVYLFMIKEK